jgi:hypothetical protein
MQEKADVPLQATGRLPRRCMDIAGGISPPGRLNRRSLHRLYQADDAYDKTCLRTFHAGSKNSSFVAADEVVLHLTKRPF